MKSVKEAPAADKSKGKAPSKSAAKTVSKPATKGADKSTTAAAKVAPAPAAKGADKGKSKEHAGAAAAAKGVATNGKLAATKGKLVDAKGKAIVVKGKAGAKGAADAKKGAAPPAPPRKIQVVQLTTLKPGARGTKASVARRAAAVDEVDPSQVVPAKKRRSAELTRQQLDHFRELLQVRRTRLSSDLSMMQDEALKVTAQDNSSDSVADTGTDNYEQDFTLGLIESEEALAREVDAALMRISQDAFGVCESCQTPIPLARLEILPFARLCVDCQQKREGQA